MLLHYFIYKFYMYNKKVIKIIEFRDEIYRKDEKKGLVQRVIFIQNLYLKLKADWFLSYTKMRYKIPYNLSTLNKGRTLIRGHVWKNIFKNRPMIFVLSTLIQYKNRGLIFLYNVNYLPTITTWDKNLQGLRLSTLPSTKDVLT